MTPFEKSLTVERRGESMFLPAFVRKHAERGERLMIHKRPTPAMEHALHGALAEPAKETRWGRRDGASKESEAILALQRWLGDITVMSFDKLEGLYKHTLCADFKFEEDSSNNLYLETLSNDGLMGDKDGWLRELKADEIWYCFLDSKTVAQLRLTELRAWLDEPVRSKINPSIPTRRYLYYQHKTQSKQAQSSFPSGIITPIKDIPPEIMHTTYRLEDNRLILCQREEYLELVGKYSEIAQKKRAERRSFMRTTKRPAAPEHTAETFQPRAA